MPQPGTFNGVLIAYEDGDEPEEDDESVRESVSDEEGEEEPEDMLIVAAEDFPDQSSPDMKTEELLKKKKGFSANAGFSHAVKVQEEDSNSDKEHVMEDADQRVLAGDIYLLGGYHCI